MLPISPQLMPEKGRRKSDWKIKRVRHLRTKAKHYVSRNGKYLHPYQHTCRCKCNMNIRRRETRTFYRLLQFAILVLPDFFSFIMYWKSGLKGKNWPSSKVENSKLIIFLLNKRVWKQFLLKIFDISNKRLIIFCAKTNHLARAEPDKRSKLIRDWWDFVINNIKKFPSYQSLFQTRKCST